MNKRRRPVGPNNAIMAAGPFLETVIDYLDKRGLCAVWDGNEINVRDGGGAFNENFAIIASTGSAWYNYTVTCSPALPMPALSPKPVSKDPDCKLPASSRLLCRRDTALYDGDEFNIKRGTNLFSENYDITKAEGYSIRLYQVTCRDADH